MPLEEVVEPQATTVAIGAPIANILPIESNFLLNIFLFILFFLLFSYINNDIVTIN